MKSQKMFVLISFEIFWINFKNFELLIEFERYNFR